MIRLQESVKTASKIPWGGIVRSAKWVTRATLEKGRGVVRASAMGIVVGVWPMDVACSAKAILLESGVNDVKLDTTVTRLSWVSVNKSVCPRLDSPDLRALP